MSSSPVAPPRTATVTQKRSLWLSLVATFSVAVVPTFSAFAVLVFSQGDPYVLAAVIVSIVLTAGAVIGGAALWAAQPESEGISFADLMLWNWVRHHNAERTLVESTSVLGFDRTGRRVGPSSAEPHEQLRAMRAIASALDAQSSYTLGHSRRVEAHARKVGAALDLEPSIVEELALAAALHDLGNVAVPDAILRKAGELTSGERVEIERHALLGAEMAELTGSDAIVAGIRHHHEHWEGSGYPNGIAGTQIPLYARVIAIAEAYDAMTSARAYRHGFGTRDAIGILRAEAGGQFDPELVEVFVSSLRRPIPFLERFPLAAGLQRQLRELWLVFRRIGAVALSAIASTIAIALILGSTVLSPGTSPDETAPELAQGRDASEPLDEVLGANVTSNEDAGLERTDERSGSTPSGGTGPARDDDPLAEATQRSSAIIGEPVKFDPNDDGGGAEPGGGGQPGGGTGEPGGGTTDPGTQPEPDDGGSGGGGTTEPDPGTTPEPGGGSEPDPGTGGSGGAGSEPEPGSGGEPPSEDGKDKNPDANGNGNAYGHDKDDKEKP